MPLILGIVGGICGVALFAIEGLIFGFSAGIVLGFIIKQLQVMESGAAEPRIVEPKPGVKHADVGMVLNFADAKCNCCGLPEQEVEYYCPKCKKPYCAKCTTEYLDRKCPADNQKLVSIPEDKKVLLRKARDEGPTLSRNQKPAVPYSSGGES